MYGFGVQHLRHICSPYLFLAHLHGMVFSYDDSEIPLGAIGAWLMFMALSSNSHEKAVS
jgi:hypothetical protein